MADKKHSDIAEESSKERTNSATPPDEDLEAAAILCERQDAEEKILLEAVEAYESAEYLKEFMELNDSPKDKMVHSQMPQSLVEIMSKSTIDDTISCPMLSKLLLEVTQISLQLPKQEEALNSELNKQSNPAHEIQHIPELIGLAQKELGCQVSVMAPSQTSEMLPAPKAADPFADEANMDNVVDQELMDEIKRHTDSQGDNLIFFITTIPYFYSCTLKSHLVNLKGFISSSCPTEVTLQYLRLRPIPKRKKAPEKRVPCTLEKAALECIENNIDLFHGGNSTSATARKANMHINARLQRQHKTFERINQWNVLEKDRMEASEAWTEFVDVVGFMYYWPRFIYDAFNKAKFNNHARMIVVHFAVLNSTSWETLDNALMASLGENYFVKDRREQVYKRYISFFEGSPEMIAYRRSKSYSYSVRGKGVFYLNDQPKFV